MHLSLRAILLGGRQSAGRVLVGLALLSLAWPHPAALAQGNEDTAPRAHLHLLSPGDTLDFYWRPAPRSTVANLAVPDDDGFYRLCSAPCTTSVPLGRHLLGISPDYGNVLPAGDLAITGDTEIEARFHSRRWVRMTGWLVAVAGLVTGTYYMANTTNRCSVIPGIIDGDVRCSDLHPTFGAGLAVALGSLAVGIPLTFWRDSVQVAVRPQTP